MTDKMSTQPIEPMVITVIKGTGDGGAPLTTGSVATTPDHQPNLIINAVTPLVAIAVRFLNSFFTALSGLLVAAMTPAGKDLLYTSDFWHLLLTCSSLALPIALGPLGTIKDLITIFGKLENKYPLSTGSV